jgi:FKBP-type peptidyl-prolyl cis-trans isomerase SlyD
MKVSQNKVVSLTYELSVREGEESLLVEKVSPEQPFVYLHGMSGLPEKFEGALENLETGAAFDFSLSKEESGYGELDPSAVVDLPLEVFMVDGVFDSEMVAIGNFIPMSDTEGNKMQGLVKDVTEQFVKMDFNHPLAGRDLFFKGSIHGIREASAEELDHGHVHGEGGHHH